MGNNTSTGERAGGGLLTIFGVILAFTPAGPFTSTWMIPAGGALLTGKDQPTGVGITYTDDGKGTIPYIGNPDNELAIRERMNNYENMKKENDKRLFEIAKSKFNIDKLPIRFDNYCLSVKKVIEKKPQQNKNQNSITTYTFDGTNNNGGLFFNNNLNIFKSIENISGEFADKIYVIRRKLDSLPIYAGWFAHSGLLIETNNNNFYICEYGTEDNQNKVSLYKIPKEVIKYVTLISYNGRTWDKQFYGSQLDRNKKISVESIKETMVNHTTKHLYSMFFWNCHIAQETTREKLGLEVKNKYFDEQYQKEHDIMLGCFN
jgi:hypothetical protein